MYVVRNRVLLKTLKTLIYETEYFILLWLESFIKNITKIHTHVGQFVFVQNNYNTQNIT